MFLACLLTYLSILKMTQANSCVTLDPNNKRHSALTFFCPLSKGGGRRAFLAFTRNDLSVTSDPNNVLRSGQVFLQPNFVAIEHFYVD